jgi:hypothetical protein
LTSLTGTEFVLVDNGGPYDTVATSEQVANLILAGGQAYTTNTATAGVTLTTGNVYAGQIETTLNLTGTLGGAANAQLPTAPSLFSAIQNSAAGNTYKLTVINSSSGAYAWTVTTNTGWTLAGTMTIAQNTTRSFYVTLTSATTATLTSVGTGTYS